MIQAGNLPHPPIWSQREKAAFVIKEMVQRGSFSREGYLPSIRKLSEIIGQNRDAVWRALNDLEEAGYLRSAGNRRFQIAPSVRDSQLRILNVAMIFVGVGSIYFGGLQRFHNTLLSNQSLLGMQFHLHCVRDAARIDPEWMKDVDAAIFGGYFVNSHLLKEIPATLPRIGIITTLDWEPDFLVHTDNHLGGRLAAQRLFERGCRRPVLLGYTRPDLEKQTTLRKLGFQSEWIEHTSSIDAVQTGFVPEELNSFERIIALKEIVENLSEFDSAFCLNKEAAIDLLGILQHLKVDVPAKVKIISFDGTFESLTTQPKLTHIKQDFETMATIVAEKIRVLCGEKDGVGTKKILIPPHLVVRESA
jgi:DNA-binding LacI/PurR family transcriptional regulator